MKYLKNTSKEQLIEELGYAGFTFKDQDGDLVDPKQFDVTKNNEGANVVWLGQIPLEDATYDEQGEQLTPVVMSEDYHANVIASSKEYPSEVEAPSNPFNTVGENPPEKVPQRITAAQGIAQLEIMGIREQVSQAVASDSLMKTFYHRATFWERSTPALSQLAQAFEIDLDEFFINASKIKL